MVINDLSYKSDKRTMVDKATTFDGDVKSEYSIDVRGVVKGSVYSNSDVFVYNTCLGKVNGANVYCNAGSLVGNGIEAFNNILVKTNATVKGIINCNSIEIHGEVDDIVAESNVFLSSTAIVHGNITCHELIADDNSKIEGMVHIIYNSASI